MCVRSKGMLRPWLLPVVVFLLSAGTGQSWQKFEDGCNNAGCHDFMQGSPNLHTRHQTGATSNCGLCHMNGASPAAPLYTYRSDPAASGTPIGLGCTGCHGADYGQKSLVDGLPKASGYGLAVKHDPLMTSPKCTACHAHMNPNPLPECAVPPYYARPDVVQKDPCNQDGTEDFDGDGLGLDNDGNGLADMNDPACVTCPCWARAAAGPFWATLCQETSLTLSGVTSVSSCAPGGALTYEWWLGPAGLPSSTLVGTGATYDLPTDLAPGAYSYDLRVACDNDPACSGSLNFPIGITVAALPAAIVRLFAVKDGTGFVDVSLSWTIDPVADLSRAHSVDFKTQIPPNEANPNATQRCETPDALTDTCVHQDAVPGAPGDILFYQAVGVCAKETEREGPN